MNNYNPESGDFLSRDPFEDFEGTYELDGKSYDVTIKYLSNDNDTGGTYTAVCTDGTIIKLDYIGKWIDEDSGETEHAFELGKLIQEHQNAVEDNPAFRIKIYIDENVVLMPEDDVPFLAWYTLPTGTSKHVIIQSSEIETGHVLLVRFRNENEVAYRFDEMDADLIIHWSDEQGWVERTNEITLGSVAVGAIVDKLLSGNQDEEVTDENPGSEEALLITDGDLETEPLADFEGSYELDGTTYEVSIKNMPVETGDGGYFAVAYSDGTIRRVNPVLGNGWLDLDKGKSLHADKIGELIHQHFTAPDPDFDITFGFPEPVKRGSSSNAFRA